MERAKPLGAAAVFAVGFPRRIQEIGVADAGRLGDGFVGATFHAAEVSHKFSTNRALFVRLVEFDPLDGMIAPRFGLSEPSEIGLGRPFGASHRAVANLDRGRERHATDDQLGAGQNRFCSPADHFIWLTKLRDRSNIREKLGKGRTAVQVIISGQSYRVEFVDRIESEGRDLDCFIEGRTILVPDHVRATRLVSIVNQIEQRMADQNIGKPIQARPIPMMTITGE